MLNIVSRSIKPCEPDLLLGNEKGMLIVRTLEATSFIEVEPPQGGWTHDALDHAVKHPDVLNFLSANGGADAYLGSDWIGSTEV